MATIKITQIRSTIRQPKRQKLTMEALGLRQMRQTVEHEDSASVRGMLDKVSHLVQVEEQQ